MALRIALDALVVLIGAAGCGKSTFARRHFSKTEIVSSDECRALVSDDEADARASRDAFALMHFIIDKRLKRGRLTVADATNVRAEKRAELLEIARRHRRPAFAVVFDLPVGVCEEFNRLRPGRVVPVQALRAHSRQLAESLPSLAGEGFESIYVLSSPDELDRVVVERVAIVSRQRASSSTETPIR